MTSGRVRVARAWVMAACLAVGVVSTAAAEPVCAPDRRRPGDLVDVTEGFAPTFRTDSAVPMVGIFRLTLKPSTEVRYYVGSTRAFGDDDGYGGVVTFPVLAAGRYYVHVSEPAAVELVQNYRQLALHPRPENSQGREVDIDDGAVVLQVRAAAMSEVTISISTPPPCRR